MCAGRGYNNQQDGYESTKARKIIALASAADLEAFAVLQGVNKVFLATQHEVSGGVVCCFQCREMKAQAPHQRSTRTGL